MVKLARSTRLKCPKCGGQIMQVREVTEYRPVRFVRGHVKSGAKLPDTVPTGRELRGREQEHECYECGKPFTQSALLALADKETGDGKRRTEAAKTA